MSNRFRLLLVLAAVLGLGSLGWAQQQDSDTFHWTGKLAANQLLQIKNINGVIDAEGTQGDTIDVSAVKSGPDRNQVRVEVVQAGEGVTICAVYPDSSCNGEGGSHSHGNIKARVDFTVKVPRNLRFNAFNVNGNIKADDLGRPAKINTVNGAVDATSSSWVKSSSVNGNVKVAMGAADWDGTLKISSVNGSVTLELPLDTNAEVHFSSVNGRLESDFPLNVQGMSFGPKNLHGTIGNGGRQLDVSTVNGSLYIRKGKGAM